MAVLPQPTIPYDPTNPSSVVVWNNYWLSLAGIEQTSAPIDAQYFVSTPHAGLSNERNLGSLLTGFLFLTVAAGIAVPSTTTSGAGLTGLNASNLASGTVPDARFPSTLPAVSGVNLTALNASNLGSGILPAARFPSPTDWTPALTGASGSGITYTTQTGRYIALGRFILASFNLVVSGLGTAAGQVTLTGLPATVENSTDHWGTSVVEWANLTTAIISTRALLLVNTTTANFSKITAATTSSFGGLVIADLSATTILRGILAYVST